MDNVYCIFHLDDCFLMIIEKWNIYSIQQLNVPAIYEAGLFLAVVLLMCHIFQCDSLPLFIWGFDFGANMAHFNKMKFENKKILALNLALKQDGSAPEILNVQRLSLKFTKDGLEIFIKAPALC